MCRRVVNARSIKPAPVILLPPAPEAAPVEPVAPVELPVFFEVYVYTLILICIYMLWTHLYIYG
jgi:hypothetical protein